MFKKSKRIWQYDCYHNSQLFIKLTLRRLIVAETFLELVVFDLLTTISNKETFLQDFIEILKPKFQNI